MMGAKILSGKNAAQGSKPSAPLASHPSFAWIMIGWSLLLFGLATFVIARAFSGSTVLPIVLGLIASGLGAACGLQFARNVGAKVPQITLPKRAQKTGQKAAQKTAQQADEFEAPKSSILSTKDLGSESLDAPLELAADAQLRADDLSDEELETYYEDAFAHDGLREPASPNDRHGRAALGRPQFDRDEPLALEEFAIAPVETNEEPGEDSEEETPAPAQVFTACDSAQPAETAYDNRAQLDLGQDAEIIPIKERDLADLSLVQMVERFAVGLNDHRKARVNDPASHRVRPSDPRIAQAIRDLPISDLKPKSDCSSTRAQAEQTEAALREALEKLQRMSDHA